MKNLECGNQSQCLEFVMDMGVRQGHNLQQRGWVSQKESAFPTETGESEFKYSHGQKLQPQRKMVSPWLLITKSEPSVEDLLGTGCN